MGSKNIRREDLIQRLQGLQEIFDLVRIVEPSQMHVITSSQGKEYIEPMQSCYSVWEKDNRCDNCISLKACEENRRFTKFERVGKDTFCVIAVPYKVTDKYGSQIVALELVNKVTQELQ